MTQPYKMYRFKCKNCTREYTSNKHISNCPKCSKENQNIGKYTPYS